MSTDRQAGRDETLGQEADQRPMWRFRAADAEARRHSEERAERRAEADAMREGGDRR